MDARMNIYLNKLCNARKWREKSPNHMVHTGKSYKYKLFALIVLLSKDQNHASYWGQKLRRTYFIHVLLRKILVG